MRLRGMLRPVPKQMVVIGYPPALAPDEILFPLHRLLSDLTWNTFAII